MLKAMRGSYCMNYAASHCLLISVLMRQKESALLDAQESRVVPGPRLRPARALPGTWMTTSRLQTRDGLTGVEASTAPGPNSRSNMVMTAVPTECKASPPPRGRAGDGDSATPGDAKLALVAEATLGGVSGADRGDFASADGVDPGVASAAPAWRIVPPRARNACRSA